MALILSELFAETGKKYELQLIAGKNGLNREVKWVYVAEDKSNAGFLRAGELIISTGALYDRTDSWLLHFVRLLNEHHTNGLILNIGKQLSAADITDKVIAYCDAHNYPLFVMPWHIHIYDITRDYYDRIFEDSRRNEDMDFYRLLQAIDNPSVPERFVTQKLKPVLDYDLKHNSNLADTLFLYLKHWGSIQHIASESYCHRNTVTKRIHILREQLGFCLDEPSERFELMAAFMVREYLQTQK